MPNDSNIEKWIKFLEPENLKGNLMFASLYIAAFESFKDYVIEEVKFFFHNGFKDGQDIFDPKYETHVKSKDKSVVKASLLWLLEMEAIDESDILLFDDLRQYRNKLSHELMTLLFDGLPEELPAKFAQLIQGRIKIEKWWIINIEIPTNPDFDQMGEINEDAIIAPSQMINKLICDMLSGDEKTATLYRDEFLKQYKN